MKELDTYEKIALNSIAIDPTTTDDAYKLYRLSKIGRASCRERV